MDIIDVKYGSISFAHLVMESVQLNHSWKRIPSWYIVSYWKDDLVMLPAAKVKSQMNARNEASIRNVANVHIHVEWESMSTDVVWL